MLNLDNLTEEQLEAKKLLEQGKSNREVARVLWERESKESTLRNWVKQGLLDVEDTGTTSGTKGDDISEDVLDELCSSEDYSVSNLAKRLRTAQKTNTQLRKIQREIFDTPKDLVSEAINNLGNTLGNLGTFKPTINVAPTEKTVEILFSDLQIGKCSQFYNTEVAKKAMEYYGQQVHNIVLETKPEKIVFASLGDIIECSKKHGQQSAYSTDTSNAQQLSNAIDLIWNKVVKPLVDLNIPMHILGVAGNHGSDAAKGFDMYKAGLYTYDLVIYKTLEQFINLYGANHVTIDIPEGCFTTYEIYGNKYLYEHGYFNSATEKSMMDHKKKRMDNLKDYLHGYRCGDMHHVCLFDCSNLVVNGAFFGIEMEGGEYSGILGFNSIPAQVVMVHSPSGNTGTTSVVDTKVIQIAKGY